MPCCVNERHLVKRQVKTMFLRVKQATFAGIPEFFRLEANLSAKIKGHAYATLSRALFWTIIMFDNIWESESPF